MSFGFRVYSESGKLQVSSDAKMLALKARGTHALSTNPSPAPLGTYRSCLDIGGNSSPVLALRPQDPEVWVAISQRTPGSSSFRMLSNSGSALVDWWLFDEPGPPTESYGIVVYAEDGSVTYHSFCYPMKIVGLGSMGVPPGRTYAVVQGSLSGVQTWDYAPGSSPGDENPLFLPFYYWDAIGRHDDSSISVEGQMLDRGTAGAQPGPPPDVGYGPSNFVVVDVTGY